MTYEEVIALPVGTRLVDQKTSREFYIKQGHTQNLIWRGGTRGPLTVAYYSKIIPRLVIKEQQ